MKPYYILCGTIICLFAWFISHHHYASYGTTNIPLHSIYTGDEQSPINGALHILKNKSLLAVNESGTYYGPMLAALAVPAVLADYGHRYISGQVTGSEEYKDYIVWDWGGALYFSRQISLLFGFLGLVALYLIIIQAGKMLAVQNTHKIAVLTVAVLATNYIYFNYSAFFRHWIFLAVPLLWQLYLLLLITNGDISKRKGFILSGLLAFFSFSIYYVAIIFQAFWIPYLIHWYKNKDWNTLKAFSWFVGTGIIGGLIVFFWYPEQFLRLLSMGASDSAAVSTNFGAIIQSFTSTIKYYLSTGLLHSSLLVAALGVLAYREWGRLSSGIKRFVVAVSLTMFAHATLLLFTGFMVGRYILPIIVLGTVLVGIFLLSQQNRPLGSPVRLLVGLILAVQMLFGVYTLIQLGSVYAPDPLELEILDTIKPEDTVLIYRDQFYGLNELVGVPHTQAAYDDYFKNNNLENLEYVNALKDSKLSSDRERYGIYYDTISNKSSVKDGWAGFDHVFYCERIRWTDDTEIYWVKNKTFRGLGDMCATLK